MAKQSSATFGWLTGNEIGNQVRAGRIQISPFTETALNPNSYNYRLGATIRRLSSPIIDLRKEDEYETLGIPEEGLVLMPGECYLGCTVESFGSEHFAALVTGRSSIGRKFITNHITAGLIDQGYFGKITLEITVQKPTRVYVNAMFGQIFWFTSVGTATLYAGKYVGQMLPTSSRAHLDKSSERVE